MSVNDFLILWLGSFAVILACRVAPFLVLRGRSLSPRVVEALGYIPPAAFAALAANDLIAPGAVASSGLVGAVAPWIASALVVVLTYKTRSMLLCCLVGTVCYVAMSFLA